MSSGLQETSDIFVAQGRPLQAAEARVADHRGRWWSKRFSGDDPILPREEQLTALLRAAAVSRDDFNRVVGTFLNRDLRSSPHESSQALLRIAGEDGPLAKAARESRGDERSRYRQTWIQIVCHCMAHAYSTGFRGYDGLNLGNMNRLLAGLLREELRDAKTTGHEFGDWHEIKKFLSGRYPYLNRYGTTAGFTMGVFGHTASDCYLP